MNVDQYETMATLEESHWYFCGKRKLVGRFLPDKGRILDIGAGTGGTALTLLVPRGLKSCSVEFSPEALRFAAGRKVPRMVRASAEALPFRSGVFDGALSLDVLEHLPFPEKACEEMQRVLRADGTALLTVPAFSFLWSSHDEVLHHYRRYDFVSLERILPPSFRILHRSCYNILLFPVALAWRTFRKLRPEGVRKDDFYLPPGPINALLKFLLSIEARLIPHFSFPLGIGLFYFLRKR